MSPARALMCLTEAGYDVGGPLDTDCVAELVDWIHRLDCYELRGGSLSDMVSQIRNLLR